MPLVCLVQVDMVLLPALTGDFGVMPGHVPTVAQLRPGVVTVHNTLDREVDKCARGPPCHTCLNHHQLHMQH